MNADEPPLPGALTWYEAPRRAAQNDRPTSRPSLTPLIDVTFLLLLFFLLTFTFRQAEGLIPGTLPGRGPDGMLIPDPIVVDVVRPLDTTRADAGVFFIEGERFDTSEGLYNRLTKMQQRITRPVKIKPSRGVRWEHVVDAFSQAVRAKCENVGFSPAGWSADAANTGRLDQWSGVEVVG